MATLCLVHGSTQNARCWDLLIPELARHGHQVITVDLPKSEPHFGVSDFAAVILREIPPTVSDLAIVGHSASGIFLPVVAARRPVRLLVYFAAMIPLPGSSVRTQVQTYADMFNPEWVAAGSGWLDPERWADLADRFLFHDCPEDTRQWARGTVHPMRIEGLLDEPCPMSSLINWPSICLICSLDRTINPAWQEKVWRERTGKAVIKLEAGHCPHVSQPAKTADAILSALGRTA